MITISLFSIIIFHNLDHGTRGHTTNQQGGTCHVYGLGSSRLAPSAMDHPFEYGFFPLCFEITEQDKE